MSKFTEFQEVMFASVDELSVIAVFVNFLGAISVSFIVSKFYGRYSTSLTGKAHISVILPILTGIIFLIIVVVKTSLALSLGLVGALSIVRFRTPIKEPEELTYIFLAIAIGLGFGAGFPSITLLIVMSLLTVIYFFLSNKNSKSSEYNLVVNWSGAHVTQRAVRDAIYELSSSLKLVRFEHSREASSAVFLMQVSQGANIDTVIDRLNELDENLTVTFFEAKVNW